MYFGWVKMKSVCFLVDKVYGNDISGNYIYSWFISPEPACSGREIDPNKITVSVLDCRLLNTIGPQLFNNLHIAISSHPVINWFKGLEVRCMIHECVKHRFTKELASSFHF